MSPKSTIESVTQYFSKFGTVLKCSIAQNNVSDKFRCFGCIIVEPLEAAQKIISITFHYLDDKYVEAKEFNDRLTSVKERLISSNKPIAKKRSIFVLGLSIGSTEEEIVEYFNTFGEVISVFFVNKNNKRNQSSNELIKKTQLSSLETSILRKKLFCLKNTY